MAEDPKIVNDFKAIHDHIQHAKRHLHEADTITLGHIEPGGGAGLSLKVARDGIREATVHLEEADVIATGHIEPGGG